VINIFGGICCVRMSCHCCGCSSECKRRQNHGLWFSEAVGSQGGVQGHWWQGWL